MATAKTTALSLRIDPFVKEGLRVLAEKEHRSIANMIEMMIRDYCKRNGVPIPEQHVLFTEGRKPATRGK